MKKIVDSGYIIGLSELTGQDITSEEENDIRFAISTRPEQQSGYSYRLKSDLTWEAYPLSPEPEPSDEDEISTDEALNILLGGAQ